MIPIGAEPDPSRSWERERCCVCRDRTTTWTVLPDRTPGAQVALCADCAATTEPADVPTKDAWFAREVALEKSTRR